MPSKQHDDDMTNPARPRRADRADRVDRADDLGLDLDVDQMAPVDDGAGPEANSLLGTVVDAIGKELDSRFSDDIERAVDKIADTIFGEDGNDGVGSGDGGDSDDGDDGSDDDGSDDGDSGSGGSGDGDGGGGGGTSGWAGWGQGRGAGSSATGRPAGQGPRDTSWDGDDILVPAAKNEVSIETLEVRAPVELDEYQALPDLDADGQSARSLGDTATHEVGHVRWEGPDFDTTKNVVGQAHDRYADLETNFLPEVGDEVIVSVVEQEPAGITAMDDWEAPSASVADDALDDTPDAGDWDG